MTMISGNCPAAATHAVSPRFSVLATLQHINAVWRQRRTLKSLDAAALNDIGLTRAQVKAEAGRPIWDAPQSWVR
jgi:uncharacterized protein YjiS (DUF1127 family)